MLEAGASTEELLPNSQRGTISIIEATLLLANLSMGILMVTAPLCWYYMGWLLGFVSLSAGALLQIQAASA